jgi:hypothetical protein
MSNSVFIIIYSYFPAFVHRRRSKQQEKQDYIHRNIFTNRDQFVQWSSFLIE